MKKISVYGSSYSDICLLLGSVLAEMGEKTTMLVTDSEAQMWYCLPKLRGSARGEIGELGRMSFARSLEEIDAATTYLFEICGLKPASDNDDERYIMVVAVEEPEILHKIDVLDDMGELAISDDSRRITVLRDCMGMLTKERHWIKTENAGKLFEVSRNRKDRRAELYLALREDMSYRRVSERFVGLLEKVTCIVREATTVKEFETAYKRIMKGGSL